MRSNLKTMAVFIRQQQLLSSGFCRMFRCFLTTEGTKNKNIYFRNKVKIYNLDQLHLITFLYIMNRSWKKVLTNFECKRYDKNFFIISDDKNKFPQHVEDMECRWKKKQKRAVKNEVADSEKDLCKCCTTP